MSFLPSIEDVEKLGEAMANSFMKVVSEQLPPVLKSGVTQALDGLNVDATGNVKITKKDA